MSELKDYKVYTTRNEGAWGYHYESNPNKDQSDIELNGERVYLKREVDKEIAELKKACNSKDDWCLHTLKENRHQKYKRCLLYAKNHKNLADLATDAARLIGLNAHAFTKETETACVAYWNRIGDCHRRHHDEWLKLAEKFKEAK